MGPSRPNTSVDIAHPQDMSSGEAAVNLARRMLNGDGVPGLIFKVPIHDTEAVARLRTAQGALYKAGWQVGSSGGVEGREDYTFAVPLSHFQPRTTAPDLERTQALLDGIIGTRGKVSVGLLVSAA